MIQSGGLNLPSPRVSVSFRMAMRSAISSPGDASKSTGHRPTLAPKTVMVRASMNLCRIGSPAAQARPNCRTSTASDTPSTINILSANRDADLVVSSGGSGWFRNAHRYRAWRRASSSGRPRSSARSKGVIVASVSAMDRRELGERLSHLLTTYLTACSYQLTSFAFAAASTLAWVCRISGTGSPVCRAPGRCACWLSSRRHRGFGVDAEENFTIWSARCRRAAG